MRGKVLLLLDAGVVVGITPAYAGKSCRWCHHRRTAWDHPRVCGEKRRRALSRYLAAGSPPRMRGKGSADVRTGQRTGITPAYAGKSPPAERSGPIRWDHPRVCGEKMDAATIQSGNAGSPPRMRGKAQSYGSGSCPHRITPAYAGKSEVPGWAAETA